jgi:hypothetical protein
MQTTRLALLVGLCLATASGGGAVSATGVPSNAASSQGDLIPDLSAYQALFDLDAKAAQVQIDEVPTIARLQANLEARYPATFGGLWIEHSPYAVVVAITDDADDTLRATLTSAGLSVEPTIRLVDRSYAELLRLGDLLAAADIGPANLAIDIVHNKVDVETPSRALAQSKITAEGVGPSTAINIIEMADLGGPAVNMYGGLGGANNNWSGCMSGFTVQKRIG